MGDPEASRLLTKEYRSPWDRELRAALPRALSRAAAFCASWAPRRSGSRPGRAWRSAPSGRYAIAFTSFAVRLQRGRDLIRGAGPIGLPAEAFVELCHSFGADGCQLDIGQLGSTEAELPRRPQAEARRGRAVRRAVGARQDLRGRELLRGRGARRPGARRRAPARGAAARPPLRGLRDARGVAELRRPLARGAAAREARARPASARGRDREPQGLARRRARRADPLGRQPATSARASTSATTSRCSRTRSTP